MSRTKFSSPSNRIRFKNLDFEKKTSKLSVKAAKSNLPKTKFQLVSFQTNFKTINNPM